MVLPLCYGFYVRPGGPAWIQKHFAQHFGTVEEYILWLGGDALLEGNAGIQANCVAALALEELK